jgi:hypothetical protein
MTHFFRSGKSRPHRFYSRHFFANFYEELSLGTCI